MSRATRVAAVLALVALVVVTAVQGRRGHVGVRAAGPPPLDLSGLGAEGAELASLLARGQAQTFHAVYRATSPEQPDASVEYWRKPPKQRQDRIISAGGETGRTASFTLPSGLLSCVQEAAGPWHCAKVDGAAGADGPDAFLRLLVGDVRGPALDVRDDTIAGAAVRCFRFPLPAATADVCATRSGVPARISDGSSLIELTSLTGVVGDAVFRPPAAAG